MQNTKTKETVKTEIRIWENIFCDAAKSCKDWRKLYKRAKKIGYIRSGYLDLAEYQRKIVHQARLHVQSLRRILNIME